MSHEHFDAVIVGSGFGGSVVAQRLAEQNKRVCVLERGRAYPPGSFPRTPHGVKKAFWDPSEGLYGMFDLWSFTNMDGLVSSALGGGSIIYANVFLRKDEKWFVKEDLANGGYEYWPVTRADLDPHYDAAERMIGIQTYPFDQEPYRQTPKTVEFKEAAERLGLDWNLVPLAVTFANEGEPAVPGEPIRGGTANLHGRTRYTCQLCGECDLGCNYGSKNTLDFTCLSRAQEHGADIRTLCEVRSFEPNGKGYVVNYVQHDISSEGKRTNTAELPLQKITADHLILSAGTFGSTYLLLKNRESLPNLSRMLGTRFGGNGDLLTFALNARRTDAATGDKGPRYLDPNYGPVITSAIRGGDLLDGKGDSGRGFYIEDSGYPAFMSWLVEATDVMGTFKRFARVLGRSIRSRLGGDTNLSAEFQGLLGDTISSCAMPMLGMGRDIPNGQFTLDEKGHLECDWERDGSLQYFDRLREKMRLLTEQLEAEFVTNPTWLLNRVVTVHPLGGSPMGRSVDEGVVDSYGRVFNYPGLYVADGSIMPGPVGANPSLTIAALAHRIADGILDPNLKP